MSHSENLYEETILSMQKDFEGFEILRFMNFLIESLGLDSDLYYVFNFRNNIFKIKNKKNHNKDITFFFSDDDIKENYCIKVFQREYGNCDDSLIINRNHIFKELNNLADELFPEIKSETSSFWSIKKQMADIRNLPEKNFKYSINCYFEKSYNGYFYNKKMTATHFYTSRLIKFFHNIDIKDEDYDFLEKHSYSNLHFSVWRKELKLYGIPKLVKDLSFDDNGFLTFDSKHKIEQNDY